MFLWLNVHRGASAEYYHKAVESSDVIYHVCVKVTENGQTIENIIITITITQIIKKMKVTGCTTVKHCFIITSNT